MREKSFYKVTELSEEFKEFAEGLKQEADDPSLDRKTRVHLKVLLWQLRIQLAVAQQLTMVSQHLGEVVEKSKEQS